MLCILHHWLISRAADARQVVPTLTQKHLSLCDGCRAYAELCARLPLVLTAGAPVIVADSDLDFLKQRILAQAVRAPEFSKVWKRPALVFPRLGKIAEIFSKPWKPAVAVFAVACLLLALGLNRQHTNRIQRQSTLAALQEVRLACDAALIQGPTAAVGGLLDAATQSLVADAASAMKHLGDILPLPPVAPTDRSG